MSLRNNLRHTIATLDRIAPHSEAETTHSIYSADDEKTSFDSDCPSNSYRTTFDDEKFIRLSTSTRPSPYLGRSRSHPSLHSARLLPEVDLSKIEVHGDDASESKLGLRYLAKLTLEFLPIPLSFINLAVAACIIGLAADNIDWAKASGSWASDITIGHFYDEDDDSLWPDMWVTKMFPTPALLSTTLFNAFVVAGSICTLGSAIVGPLSIVYWKSLKRRIKLSTKKKTSHPHLSLLVCLILDTIMFLGSVIALIILRPLYERSTGYTGNIETWKKDDPYRISPKNLYPPLPPIPDDRHHLTIENYTWTPMDDIKRYYLSDVEYNPMNWNCRLQCHVLDPVQHRVWGLCEEANAARFLLVALVAMELVVLGLHGWALWKEKNRIERRVPWMRQERGSEDWLGEEREEATG